MLAEFAKPSSLTNAMTTGTCAAACEATIGQRRGKRRRWVKTKQNSEIGVFKEEMYKP
jgi:hypothetical protein